MAEIDEVGIETDSFGTDTSGDTINFADAVSGMGKSKPSKTKQASNIQPLVR